MKHAPYTRPKRALNSQMNVVPYIDVMLVLLVIFMVTAPMLTTGVEVELPKEQTQAIKADAQLPAIISIKADGSLFLSSKDGIDVPMDETTLITTLQALAGEQTDDLQVFINADSQNQYQTVVHTMAALQQAGITKVGLMTERTP